MSYVGSDVESLRRAAQQLRATADEIDGHAHSLTGVLGSVDWIGGLASRFLASWSGVHRANLTSTSTFFREAAEKLERNAREQEQASSASGRGRGPIGRWPGRGNRSTNPDIGPWSRIPEWRWWGRPLPWTPFPFFPGVPMPRSPGPGMWGSPGTPIDGFWGDVGNSLRTVDGDWGIAGPVLGTIGDAKGIPGFDVAGKTFAGFGYATSGYTALEDFAHGRYVDGAIESTLLVGDVTADKLKSSATPVGYAGGVAVQAWTEAGREARNVDWSMDGLNDIRNASLGDWGGAAVETAKALPTRLIKIFGL